MKKPMRGRGRRLRDLWRSIVLSSVVTLLSCASLLGQDDDGVRLGITYRPGYVPALAITDVASEGALRAVAAAVDSILTTDLDYSDRFELLAVPDSLPSGSEVNYGLWNQLGAVWLLEGNLTASGGQAVLRISLHDVVYGALKNVQAFTLPSVESEDFRMAVHRISDAIVEWATGEPGMAASRIAFIRRIEPGNWDVYVIDSDGHNLRRVTRDETVVYSPAFSPDGSHLLYQSNAGGTPAIYELDLATGRARIVAQGGGLNITPTYSPDGARLMYARTTGNGTEIYEIDRQGGDDRRRITNTTSGDALSPSYSPDGTRIAFTGSSVGAPQVYVLDLTRSRPALVSRFVRGADSYATSPDWNPIDDRIVYHARVQGRFQLVTVNANGSEMRLLTESGNNEEPSWAPDGRHVVFASDRGGYRGLWVLDTVSGRTRNLTRGQHDQLPDWSGAIGENP